MSVGREKSGSVIEPSVAGRVRVQSGPHGRELIVDETLASLFPAEGIATGCVWDAIAAPVLALPPERRRRFLLLGLAGGSAARIVRALAPGAEIVAVEVDRDVVRAARRHFELDALDLELIVDDALAVLRRERRRFDAVLEDVFIGYGDDVHKPDWIPHPGLDLAARRVRDGGLLVSNTLDETRQVAKALATHFPRTLCIDVDEYDNRVLVAGPKSLEARALRAAVAREASLSGSLRVLRFRRWRL
ncbi:MAG: hypothetical protein JRH17_08575 [Deltaproteobacteria bacterium]|nr:hypothetical protein [Deltaproteobacteria bacterium]MBW2697544.1 hypothetical protein [Deltaproteobacteria bacterium]